MPPSAELQISRLWSPRDEPAGAGEVVLWRGLDLVWNRKALGILQLHAEALPDMSATTKHSDPP